MWKGIDWANYIGKTVEIIVVDCVGNELGNFKPCKSFEDLTHDSGRHYHLGRGYSGCPNHIWAYPLFLLGSPKII
jgi:hypothetical protein